MSNDKSRELQEAFGVPVRKANITDFPPQVAFAFGLLGIDTANMYELMIHPDEPCSDNSKN